MKSMDTSCRQSECRMRAKISGIHAYGQWKGIPVGFRQSHSPQMAHVSCRDPTTRHFDYGMQSAVHTSTPLKGIPVGLGQSHSPQMAHVSCRDPPTKHFNCGIQSVVCISTPCKGTSVLPHLRHSPQTAWALPLNSAVGSGQQLAVWFLCLNIFLLVLMMIYCILQSQKKLCPTSWKMGGFILPTLSNDSVGFL